jgi:hypothetical protein
MKMRTKRKEYPLRVRSGWLCGALAAGLFGGPADAALKLDTHLSSEAEYDSDIFRVSPNTAEQALGTRRLYDYIWDNQLGADVEYLTGQQRLYTSGDVDRIFYRHHSDLDHNEFKWLAGMDWKLGQAVDGGVEYKDTRHMVPEEDRATPSTNLDYEADRNAGGSVNVKITPEWLAEGRVDWSEQDSPSTDVFFHVDETKYTLAGKYLGPGPITSGLQLQYVTGRAADLTQSGPYSEINTAYSLDYKSGTVSQLSLLLGGSTIHFEEGPHESFSTVTGQLTYKRSLSAKTSLNVDVFRRMEVYAVLADIVEETGGEVSMDWQASSKIFVNLTGSYSYDSFKPTPREDRVAVAGLGLKYQPLTWLSLKPAVHYQNRRSDQTLYDFGDTICSLEAKLQF